MKRTALLAIVVALLLLSGVALQTIATAAAQSDEPDSLTRYTIEKGTASGGGYHLTSLSWQIEGAASGSRYRLLGPASPTSRGNPCCCTYLPCLLRGF
jgi:hypothetical protein